jgi:fatty acid desaturase
MPYHAEHHAYPAVPFHKLPRFHEITRHHLRTTEQGYARFNRKFFRTLG